MSTVGRGARLPPWLRSWAGDSAVLLLSQIGVVVATSTLAILLARHLGPRDWGIFSGLLGLSLALSILVEFGLTQWLLRELSHLWAEDLQGDDARRPASQMVAASLAVNVALGTFMIVGAAIAAGSFGLGATSAVLLIVLVAYGALMALCSGLEAVFRARRRVGRVAAATALEKLLLLLLVAVSLALGLGLYAIGAAYLLAGLARVAFDTSAVVRTGELVLVRPSFGAARRVTHGSLPFALNRASLNIVPKLDTFILAALSPVAAGYFAVGDRGLGPVFIIPVVMSSALYPFLAREAAGSRTGLRIVFILGLVGCLVGAAGIALAPQLVPLVFGADYRGAVRVVQIMLLTVPFVFAANPLLTHLYSARLEHRRLGLRLAGVSCVGTGALAVGQALIGPTGAAAGYVARSMLVLAALAVASRGGASVDAAKPLLQALPHSGKAASELPTVASGASSARG